MSNSHGSKWRQYIWSMRECGMDADSAAYELAESGCQTIHEPSSDSIISFVSASEDLLQSHEIAAKKLGLILLNTKDVEETAWTQRCSELMAPIDLGEFLVRPIANASEAARFPDDLVIIPGMGFGTGHHATTSTVLRMLLEHKGLFPTSSESRILDAGTGSGILAIAAAKIFKTQVLAFDNDPDALNNARENVRINHLETQVEISSLEIRNISGLYSLVMANVYAELLIEWIPEFARLVNPIGHLFISGIMASQAPNVISHFKQLNWKQLDFREVDGWCTVLYQRKS